MSGQTAGVKGLLKEATNFLARLIKMDEKSSDAASGVVTTVLLWSASCVFASSRSAVLGVEAALERLLSRTVSQQS